MYSPNVYHLYRHVHNLYLSGSAQSRDFTSNLLFRCTKSDHMPMPIAQKPTVDICIICIRRIKHPLPLIESHTNLGRLFFHINPLILHNRRKLYYYLTYFNYFYIFQEIKYAITRTTVMDFLKTPCKNQGWTQVHRKEKQFLFH